jgi:hypothetical protein
MYILNLIIKNIVVCDHKERARIFSIVPRWQAKNPAFSSQQEQGNFLFFKVSRHCWRPTQLPSQLSTTGTFSSSKMPWA